MYRLKQLRHFSAIIFDMDGLVLETETAYCLAWKKALEQMNCDVTPDFGRSMLGLHQQAFSERLIEIYGKNFNLKQFSGLSGRYWLEIVSEQGIPVKQGFLNLVAEINEKKIPFCLATNSPRKNTLECLALAKITDIFNLIVCRDEVTEAKPSAEIFLLAAEKLKTPISNCLVLEDSFIGVQAGINAKATVVFIPSVLPINKTADLLADYTFESLEELVEIIRD